MCKLSVGFGLTLGILVSAGCGGCSSEGDGASCAAPACGTREAPPVAKGAAQLSKFFADNKITEIRYDKVAMHAEPKPKKVLSLADLPQETVELLVRADVDSWKRSYENESVCDGMRWVFVFVSGDRVVKRVDCFNADPAGAKYLMQACGIPRSKSIDECCKTGRIVERD